MSEQIDQVRRENEMLRRRIDRLEREVAAMQPLVRQAQQLVLWDFTPYGVLPDGSWVAVDRTSATQLLGALAGIDHWNAWHTRIEPRPQP